MPVTLESSKLQRDTVATEHLHRKLQQKQAYDKHTGQPLPDFPPGSYVYAKPPPNSKEWISGQIIGSAGPRSYFIKTGSRQIRRNRVQVQLAPPPSTIASPHQTNTTPLFPDKLRPNPLNQRPSYAPSAVFTASPNDASLSPMPSNAPPSTPTVLPESSSEVPSSPCPVTPPPAYPSRIPCASPVSPSPPAPQTVTRSGRVVRRPAR